MLFEAIASHSYMHAIPKPIGVGKGQANFRRSRLNIHVMVWKASIHGSI